MPNYWELRQIADAYEVYQEAEEVADQIGILYQKSSAYLQHEADKIFNRFRKKYGLTEKEARQLIARLGDPDDIPKLLRMLKNTQQKEEIVLLRREIESAAFRFRLERLQNLQNDIDRIMKDVYKQELKISTDFYTDIAKNAYYKGIFRIQQRANAAFSFDHVSQKVIDKVLKSRWSGDNYSKRIWKNTQELAQTLKEEMLVNLATGRTIRDASSSIAERFGVGVNKARRLVRTESNYVHTQLNFEAYKESGVEKYLYLATLDLKTSKICRSLDGKIFLVSEQKVGVNCPPMHPWCRSTTIAIIDEELLKTMQRSAIDPATGKRIKVPATMKYQEWYEKYVRGQHSDIAKKASADILDSDHDNEESDVNYLGKIDKKLYSCVNDDIVTDDVVITDERIQHIIERRGQAFYDKYHDHFLEILQDPDYIFRSNRNSALACKKFVDDGKVVNVVLRLVTSTDTPEFKNSIISAIGESEKRFEQRLRNKEILYKKE